MRQKISNPRAHSLSGRCSPSRSTKRSFRGMIPCRVVADLRNAGSLCNKPPHFPMCRARDFIDALFDAYCTDPFACVLFSDAANCYPQCPLHVGPGSIATLLGIRALVNGLPVDNNFVSLAQGFSWSGFVGQSFTWAISMGKCSACDEKCGSLGIPRARLMGMAVPPAKIVCESGDVVIVTAVVSPSRSTFSFTKLARSSSMSSTYSPLRADFGAISSSASTTCRLCRASTASIRHLRRAAPTSRTSLMCATRGTCICIRTGSTRSATSPTT